MSPKLMVLSMIFAACVSALDWYPVEIEAPVYPVLATQARIEGLVRLKLTLDSEGHVYQTDIQSGNKLLARSAMENIRLWKFGPRRQDNRDRTIKFTYDFRLEGAADHPATRFRYEHPFKAMVVSQAFNTQFTPATSAARH